ncbi:RNA-directed DNA polymerase, eukaryota, reverse transcriptase zinc-binding domain protein [Tanacetum coccineum]
MVVPFSKSDATSVKCQRHQKLNGNTFAGASVGTRKSDAVVGDRPSFCNGRIAKLSDVEATSLETTFTGKEIWNAVCGCGSEKAPGPDGTGEISRGCNASFVTLIPKVSDPIELGDYRPNSLIGFYYKIIAKLLAERIKVVVGKLVGGVQNAFVKGRYILDGVLIAKETVGYIKKARKKCLLFKVDFKKAYDSLNWDFLLEVLKLMGFGSKWCELPGDPLSSLFIILATEGLNVIMQDTMDKGLYMGVGVGELPLTYLGLPVGVSMRRESAWRPVVEKFKKRLTEWKAKTMSFGGRLTLVKSVLGSVPLVVRSIHGADGGIGAGTSFWDDMWAGEHKLRNRFPRIYYLEGCKDAKIIDRGRWVDGEWKWVWRWTREPRGRGEGELKELESILHNIIIDSSCRDTWKWSLAENGIFFVKVLPALVDEKYLDTGGNGNTMLLNKIVPKKINVFVWSALRGRLPVRVELDKKGIDIPNILCLMCDETVDTIDHALVLCNKSMRIWSNFFEWWDYGFADSFTTTDMLRHEGGNLVSSNIKVLWEAVMWITGYFIWRNRNSCVFGKKVKTVGNVVQEIKVRSYEWINTRSSKRHLGWEEWLMCPRLCGASSRTGGGTKVQFGLRRVPVELMQAPELKC